jgi:hypothetical protein
MQQQKQHYQITALLCTSLSALHCPALLRFISQLRIAAG